MTIKVCGLKYRENIDQLMNATDFQWIGYNFYPKSKRYISPAQASFTLNTLKPETKKVGVFVQNDVDELKQISKILNLDYVQLHGDESIEYCNEVADFTKIIKVFRIESELDLKETATFETVSDYFLFDTKSALFGGTGKKFSWDILDAYEGDTPFLLSGGIGPDDADKIKQITHPKFAGIDLNSRFETEPAVKDADQLGQFINHLTQLSYDV